MGQPYALRVIHKQLYQMKNMISQIPAAIMMIMKVQTIQVMREVMVQAQATQ